MIKKVKYLICFLAISLGHAAFANDDAVIVELRIKDHKFTPDIIELPANKKISIIVYNDDPTIEEFESFDLKREKIVLGNSFTKIILAPLVSGEYKFFGDFHQETAQGKIIVTEGK